MASADLELGVAVRLAGLLVDDVGQLGHPAGDARCATGEQRLGAPVEARLGPPAGGLAGARHRRVARRPRRAIGWTPTTSPVAGLRESKVSVALRSAGRLVGGGHRGSFAMRSAAFSPTMIGGALVLPRGTTGMTRGVGDPQPLDAADPQLGVDHGRSPVPIAQVPTGW